MNTDETDMDQVFRALAGPARRLLLDRLREQNGQSLQDLCVGLEMTRQSVSKHLVALEEANLVVVVRRGREKLHYLNAAPIGDLADRWISRYERERVAALSDLKRALEEAPMTKTEFVYTTYIRTTPERLWDALTEPAFTQRYWGTTFATEWSVGSEMTWRYAGVTVADPEQVVLEIDPPRRLAYTWQTVTREFADTVGFDEESFSRLERERRSKVSYDIEAVGELVKLTVIHDGFDVGSAMLESISGGWPIVLSSLKSLLETGDPLELASSAVAGAAGKDKQ